MLLATTRTASCHAAAAGARSAIALVTSPSRSLMRGLDNSPTRKAFNLSEQHPDAPHLQRYDALLSQTTNLIMRHGKKAHAARLLSDSLEHVRRLAETSAAAAAAATTTGARGSAASTRSSPTPAAAAEDRSEFLPVGTSPEVLFAQAVATCAPIVDTKSFKRGTKVMQIPRALTERQRSRKAIMWILEAAQKRTSKRFAERLGGEIADVLAGTSEAVKKKDALYKVALASRSNVNTKMNV
ncbi:hypothetical protein RI367_004056 [Sorochytrium milnesiophthora]